MPDPADLVAIVYRSRATHPMAPAGIDAFLVDVRAVNAATGVSGVLIHHHGMFFQYIEGPRDAVDAAYARIRASRRHGDIEQLLDASIAGRQFDGWHMGFCEQPASVLQELANADWEDSMPITRVDYARSEGLGMLLFHWNRWTAEA